MKCMFCKERISPSGMETFWWVVETSCEKHKKEFEVEHRRRWKIWY